VNPILVVLALLLLGAAGSILLVRRPGAGLFTALLASGLACLGSVWVGVVTLGGRGGAFTPVHWSLPLGEFRLALDGVSAWFLVMIGLVGFAAAIYSWGYLGGGKGKHANRAYAPLFCILLAAMILTVCANDALVFLLGWEFTSLSAFFLVGLADEDPKARFGAWAYLVATHLGTALGVLPVFAAFIARTGQTGLGAFAGAFDSAGPLAGVVLFALILIGFGTKAGFFPFHVWLPLAHPVAPSPVSALMSGVVVKMGLYGLIRALSWLPGLPASCGAALLVVAAVSGLFGIVSALGQRDLKRMLAYSTVENIGIMGLGIAVALIGRAFDAPLLVAFGLGGALLHAMNHALF
jgi:hydrogenase-4 component B